MLRQDALQRPLWSWQVHTTDVISCNLASSCSRCARAVVWSISTSPAKEKVKKAEKNENENSNQSGWGSYRINCKSKEKERLIEKLKW